MKKRFKTASSPLRHATIPIEYLTSSGKVLFKTPDGRAYERRPDGSIHRLTPKVILKATPKATLKAVVTDANS